jgi:5'-3' exoribonuclease 2
VFGRPAPKDEDEMMIAIFEYIDRIFAIVRPRRLLYMAIDGVVS